VLFVQSRLLATTPLVYLAMLGVPFFIDAIDRWRFC
jgi:hypothetical protein